MTLIKRAQNEYEQRKAKNDEKAKKMGFKNMDDYEKQRGEDLLKARKMTKQGGYLDKAEYLFELLKEAQGDPFAAKREQAKELQKKDPNNTYSVRQDVDDPGGFGSISKSPKGTSYGDIVRRRQQEKEQKIDKQRVAEGQPTRKDLRKKLGS